MTPQELAGAIDHTILKPDAPAQAIIQVCAEARKYRFASVCVQPCWVSVAQSELEDSGVLVCTVLGFPHGANAPEVKAFEAEDAIRRGAQELDMVLNIGAIKSELWRAVEADIAGVVNVASAGGATVKVILECALLTEPEKRRAAEVVAASGAAFVKTSTGFGPHGATPEDVALLREVVGTRCGVKAAGGIRDLPTALAMLQAGANRLGSSAGVSIVESLAHVEAETGEASRR